jgi:hypothetical protein
MLTGKPGEALRLTEEEAYSILGLCLTSPTKLDATSERALRKLAEYCLHNGTTDASHHSNSQQAMRCVS